MDECNGDFSSLKVDQTREGHDVLQMLPELFAMRGAPKPIRIDNRIRLVRSRYVPGLRKWLPARVAGSRIPLGERVRWEPQQAAPRWGQAIRILVGIRDAWSLLASRRDGYSSQRPRALLGNRSRAGAPSRVRLSPRPSSWLPRHSRVAFVGAVPKPLNHREQATSPVVPVPLTRGILRREPCKVTRAGGRPPGRGRRWRRRSTRGPERPVRTGGPGRFPAPAPATSPRRARS
jgi:hypothetical protein